MTMRLRFTAYAALVVVGLLLAVFAFLGGFRPIRITEAEDGPFLFVYRSANDTKPSTVAAITTELHQTLQRAGLRDQARPFDIFQRPESGQANEIGFVLPSGSPTQALEQDGVQVKTIARTRYMVVRFPFRNRLSFVVGFLKVDPALREYRAKKNYSDAPAIARNDGAEITYLQPVIR